MLLPISMFCSPYSSGHTVAWDQRNADHWPTCIEISLMKPITDYLSWINVCQDTFRPVAERNCLCSWVALSALFRRAVSSIYRSSIAVVACGPPCPGRPLTFLVFLESIPQPSNDTSDDVNSVCDTPLHLLVFKSAYNAPWIPVNHIVETFLSHLLSKQ